MANFSTGESKPPYAPWATFERFIKGLSGSVVPDRIDPSLMSKHSGSTQSQLRGALRFFGLVTGDDDAKTPLLAELTESSSEPERWKAQLAELVPRAYAPIVGDLKMTSATRAQLEEAFRERGGVTGSVNTKAVRFFLQAMEEAGQKLSPHFSTGKAGARSRPQTKPRRRAKKQKDASDTKPPAEMKEVGFTMPDGKQIKMWIPSTRTQGEEQFILTYLTGYFALGRQEEV